MEVQEESVLGYFTQRTRSSRMSNVSLKYKNQLLMEDAITFNRENSNTKTNLAK